ncbi:MAG: hypothetical protein JW956_00560, partial [Calditrichaceae bacterium]|nr:hypothetical protein [Calditrichaceae bacterium]
LTMGAILDIVTASFIGGFLLIILLTATDTITTESYNYHADAITQQNLSNIATIMQADIRKMGFDIPEGSKSQIVQIHNEDRLKFIAHLNEFQDYYMHEHGNLHIDLDPDTIEYRVLPFEDITYWDTTITTYQVIRRAVVSQEVTRTSMIGVLGNNDVFRYLDKFENDTNNPQLMVIVELTLTAFDPRIILSKDYVESIVDTTNGEEYRDRELRRLLRPSYWRQTRLVSKNLDR